MKVIEFNHSRFFRFGPLAPLHPSSGDGTERIHDTLARARKTVSSTIYIFHSGRSGFPDLETAYLLERLEADGFTSFEFGADALSVFSSDEIYQKCITILRQLKSGSVLFLYEPEVELTGKEVISLALLCLPGSHLDPASVWKKVNGPEDDAPPYELEAIYDTFGSGSKTKGDEDRKNGPEFTDSDSAVEIPSPSSPTADLDVPEKQREASQPTQIETKEDELPTEAPSSSFKDETAFASLQSGDFTKKPEPIARVQPDSDATEIDDTGTIASPQSPVKLSWLTIRVKLSSVIPLIIAGALITMTYFASSLFINHTRTLIQEYNLSLARLVGKQVEKDLENYGYRSRLFAESAFKTGNPILPKGEAEANYFFQENASIIYISTYSNGATDHDTYNESVLRDLDLDRTGVKDGLLQFLNDSPPEITERMQIRNASPYFNTPLIALFIPFRKDLSILTLVHSADLLQSFVELSQSGIFQVALINEKGVTLAHSSADRSLAAENLKDWDIVSNMLESNIGNGSQSFVVNGVEYLGSYQTIEPGGPGVVSFVEANKIFEAVYSIQKQNILISGIMMTLAFMLAFFFSRSITNPIVRLVGATRMIESGRYNVDITPSSRDEIGVLTGSFKNMARGLDERERIKDTFGKFVNRKIVERALRGEIRLGGEKKTAAVFFSDLRDFTGISENMDPARVVEMLNTYFTAMVDAVYKREGVVDKFIGDALMAHWGALSSTENDTANAVEAALMMREALIRINRENTSTDIPDLKFGAGINTGPVIAGQIGSNQKLEFTVIGDTVNLASRIEFLNKHFGTDILISSYSHELVKDLYQFEELPPINIKGKSKPEVVYAVLGRIDEENCPGSIQELRQMIGIQFDEEEARKRMSSYSSDTIAGNSKKGK